MRVRERGQGPLGNRPVRAPPALSGAKLTGVLLQLPCERTALAAWLARFGPLALGEAARAGGEYPVFCELWTVHDGALAMGRLDVPGSRALGQALGPYRESFVWVPDVRLGGAPAGSFVVGMLTDSALARWADVAFGFGYDKRPGRFEHAPGAWRVFGPSGREELRFTTAVAPRTRGDEERGPVLDVDAVDAYAAAPLLGVTRRGAFVRSWLARSFSGVAARALTGELSLSDYLVPGSRRRYSIGAGSSLGAATAIAFTEMSARVTYPRPLSRP